jgi:hypothetical protein
MTTESPPGQVETVLGPVAAAALGAVDAHEHRLEPRIGKEPAATITHTNPARVLAIRPPHE